MPKEGEGMAGIPLWPLGPKRGGKKGESMLWAMRQVTIGLRLTLDGHLETKMDEGMEVGKEFIFIKGILVGFIWPW